MMIKRFISNEGTVQYIIIIVTGSLPAWQYYEKIFLSGDCSNLTRTADKAITHKKEPSLEYMIYSVWWNGFTYSTLTIIIG